MGDVTWIPGGLIGFRTKEISEGESASKPELIPGAIVALRNSGEEALFASNDDEQDDEGNYKKLQAIEWIPIAQFSASPLAIATEDDFAGPGEDEPTGPRHFDVVPQSSGPSGAKKSGVRRRGE